jgi:uncharacterized PurR-regulated membrane protein YhhQ (DUF165 family)
VVQAFEAGVRSRKSDSARFADGRADSGPILIGRSSEISWGGAQARAGALLRVGAILRAAMRLILPVILLIAILSAVYMYGDVRVAELAFQPWLTLGHVLLILPFFAVMLTNRRYGPAYALAQVMIAMGVIGSVTVANAGELSALVPQIAHVPQRTVIAFACAFFIANFAGIVAFDAARGPRWWSAPLAGAVMSAAVFAGVFYTFAYLGMDEDWTHQMLVHGGVLAAAGVAMLVPYWMMRGIVPPLPGYNGY